MKTEKAIEILIAHNRYRRGETDDFMPPKEIGIAIDKAVEIMKLSINKKPCKHN